MTSPRIDIEKFRRHLAAPKRHHAEICLALLGIACVVVSRRRWENEDDRAEAITHLLIHMIERIAKYTDFEKSPINYFATMAHRELIHFRDKNWRPMDELPEE
jgi:hypothetical protein